jgi:hypothetical protein
MVAALPTEAESLRQQLTSVTVGAHDRRHAVEQAYTADVTVVVAEAPQPMPA